MTHSTSLSPETLPLETGGDTTKASKSEPILVDSDVSGVKCNGGNPALGHPEVYYSFDNDFAVTCGYCGQVFMKKKLAQII